VIRRAQNYLPKVVFILILPNVNRAKIKYALLIAVLFYAQIVSNIHAIGHLHLDASKSDHSIVQIDCDVASHVVREHSRQVIKHHTDTHSNHSSNADTDCSIYHVLLNLNGVFWSLQNNFGIPSWPGVKPLYAPETITNVAIVNKPIRAPPTIA